eukprot:31490-Pelagococcus_subviridis.AAC.6
MDDSAPSSASTSKEAAPAPVGPHIAAARGEMGAAWEIGGGMSTPPSFASATSSANASTLSRRLRVVPYEATSGWS